MQPNAQPYVMDVGAQHRTSEYTGLIGEALGSPERHASFATYAMGLWAARTDAEHQRLLHFVSNSPWSDGAVRGVAARYGLDALTARAVAMWLPRCPALPPPPTGRSRA